MLNFSLFLDFRVSFYIGSTIRTEVVFDVSPPLHPSCVREYNIKSQQKI